MRAEALLTEWLEVAELAARTARQPFARHARAIAKARLTL